MKSCSLPWRTLARHLFLFVGVAVAIVAMAEPSFADFQGSLDGIRATLTQGILPTLAVIGIIIAAFSFFTGNPNAKTHIFYAILGCVIGFGAQGIVDMIAAAVK